MFFWKLKQLLFFFCLVFTVQLKLRLVEGLLSSCRWLQVVEEEGVKVCGVLRRRRKEEEGRKPGWRRSVRWVKFSAEISHRATTFPQATFRVVWKFSVARYCQLYHGSPPPPPWGHMWDESLAVTWNDKPLLSFSEEKNLNRVSPAGSLVFKLILKRCWWFFSILWAWLNVSLADMTGGKMCDGAVISRVFTFFAFSFVTPSAILLFFFDCFHENVKEFYKFQHTLLLFLLLSLFVIIATVVFFCLFVFGPSVSSGWSLWKDATVTAEISLQMHPMASVFRQSVNFPAQTSRTLLLLK